MSLLVGSVRARSFTPSQSVEPAEDANPHVYVSGGGVELIAYPCTLDPTAARGLAALLLAAAEEHERQYTEKRR